MNAHLTVARAGLLDPLHDLGRIRAQELGMPTAGAMDPVALRFANALLGNAEGLAALEVSIMGPELRIEADSARLAVVGPVRLTVVDAPGATPRPLDADRTHRLTRG